MKVGKSNMLNAAMIVALIAIALIGHQLSPLLLPKADVTGVVLPDCDLQRQACPATLPGGGTVQFAITPRPIPFLQTLQIETIITGAIPKKVEVDFSGESMNMGYNRSVLTAVGPGRHTGEASLPVCISGGMTWVATVIIETDRQRIAVPYRFAVGH